MERKTMIVGGGPCAFNIAENLTAQGVHVVVASKEEYQTLEPLKNWGAEILLNARIMGCKGFIGNFHVSMDVDGETVERGVSNIIIAEEDSREPRFSDYGLTPTDRVVALSSVMEAGPNLRSEDGWTVVFVTGLMDEGNPVITADVMQACLEWQTASNINTYVLTRNLKVGANGLEKLYRETKEAGTVYIKFTNDLADIIQGEDGKVTILFKDEITQKEFNLMPDVTVIDEEVCPSPYLCDLANIFKIDTDPLGFLQTDNVHRLNVWTNRKGITVAGPSRGIQSDRDKIADAANAVISTLGLSGPDLIQEAAKAEITAGKCVRCLTCLRVCPHGAVKLNTGVSVVSEACEGCGICTAECPQNAIHIRGFECSDLLGSVDQVDASLDAWVPTIIAFCCTHSAVRAWEHSSEAALNLPLGLKVIEIPCGGMVSLDYIFAAFRTHADGVLVLTCHEGNCNSEQGNSYAKRRVDHIAGLLSHMGFERDRLATASLASNMAMEFTEIVQRFEKKIAGLGPSRLKNS